MQQKRDQETKNIDVPLISIEEEKHEELPDKAPESPQMHAPPVLTPSGGTYYSLEDLKTWFEVQYSTPLGDAAVLTTQQVHMRNHQVFPFLKEHAVPTTSGQLLLEKEHSLQFLSLLARLFQLRFEAKLFSAEPIAFDESERSTKLKLLIRKEDFDPTSHSGKTLPYNKLEPCGKSSLAAAERTTQRGR